MSAPIESDLIQRIFAKFEGIKYPNDLKRTMDFLRELCIIDPKFEKFNVKQKRLFQSIMINFETILFAPYDKPIIFTINSIDIIVLIKKNHLIELFINLVFNIVVRANINSPLSSVNDYVKWLGYTVIFVSGLMNKDWIENIFDKVKMPVPNYDRININIEDIIHSTIKINNEEDTEEMDEDTEEELDEHIYNIKYCIQDYFINPIINTYIIPKMNEIKYYGEDIVINPLIDED